MRPTTVTVSSQAASAWIPVDWRSSDFKISVAVVVSGTLTYDVEHTFDDIFDSTVTPTAFDHAVLNSQSTSEDGSYDSPVRAIRLNVTAFTSGSATMTILQAG